MSTLERFLKDKELLSLYVHFLLYKQNIKNIALGRVNYYFDHNIDYLVVCASNSYLKTNRLFWNNFSTLSHFLKGFYCYSKL